MQLTQLQGIIQECKKIVSKIERENTQEQRLDSQTTLISKQVRLKRIEITKIKYDLKRNVKIKKQSKETYTANQSVQRQLQNSLTIRHKEYESYRKISNVVENLKAQIDGIDKKINDAQNQLERQAKQDELITRKNQRQIEYLKLKKQLQLRSASNRKTNEVYSLSSREKLKQISKINDVIGDLDLKYQQLCEKIEVQREIINKIYSSQLNSKSRTTQNIKSKTQVDVQQQNAIYHFKKPQDLSLIQKAQVTRILLQEQFKKQQEDCLMGRVVRQNIKNTYHLGRIVDNSYRFNYNLSNISKVSDTSLISPSFQSNAKIDFLNQNQRLKRLQASKRIRTRQTQMRRYSHQYRNFLLNQSEQKDDIDPLPSSNIIDVYNQLKKAQTSKTKVGNIEIIKVMKYRQKRKKLNSERGGGLQICD